MMDECFGFKCPTMMCLATLKKTHTHQKKKEEKRKKISTLNTLPCLVKHQLTYFLVCILYSSFNLLGKKKKKSTSFSEISADTVITQFLKTFFFHSTVMI